jgi:hypothetical protein
MISEDFQDPDIAYMAAAAQHDLESMDIALSNGADINAFEGQALREAVNTRDMRMLEFLIFHGADCMVGDGRAFLDAIEKDFDEGVVAMLSVSDKLVEFSKRALSAAARLPKPDVLKTLLQFWAYSKMLSSKAEALNAAVESAKPQNVRALLENGAVCKPKIIASSLKQSMLLGSGEILDIVLSHADGSAQEWENFIDELLIFSAGQCGEAVTDTLIAYGADMDVRNGLPLVEAILNNRRDNIFVLRQCGANIATALVNIENTLRSAPDEMWKAVEYLAILNAEKQPGPPVNKNDALAQVFAAQASLRGIIMRGLNGKAPQFKQAHGLDLSDPQLDPDNYL